MPPVAVRMKTREFETTEAKQHLLEIEQSVTRRFEHLLAVERGGIDAITLELSICAEDPFYWLHWYGWTYDPRNVNERPPLPAFLPFDMCKRQVELWNWFEYILKVRQDGACKKSRGIGFTWQAGAFAWHKWRFVKGFKTNFGSRKAQEVDQIGNLDTIFEKIRLLYRALPRWMWPKGFSPNDHDKLNLLINPENDNVIRGEGGDEIGRGGRATLFIIDEASVIEHADRVDAATSANADVRIWGSTINPKNENNLFARKYNGFPPDRVFRFHYTEQPIWTPKRIADKKASINNDEIWAAEFEIDDTYTVEDICIPAAWVQSAIKLKALYEAKTGNKLEPLSEGIAGGDVGGGKAQSVVLARYGSYVTVPVAWGNPDTTDTAFKMLDYCSDTVLPPRSDNWVPRIRTLRYDSVAIGQGVASTLKRNPRKGLIIVGVNTGEAASDTRWPDGKYSHEKFMNMKAEGWWTLRERSKKTHEMVLFLQGKSQEDGAKEHPVDELLSLPDDPNDVHVTKLTSQLSQPKWFRRENGKIQIESKESMARRGLASPDYADALVLTCCGISKAEKLAAWAKVRV